MALKPKKSYTNVRSAYVGYLKLEKVRDIKISKFFSFSMPQNQEEKQILRYEVRFTNKNHSLCGLFAKHAKNFYCLT